MGTKTIIKTLKAASTILQLGKKNKYTMPVLTSAIIEQGAIKISNLDTTLELKIVTEASEKLINIDLSSKLGAFVYESYDSSNYPDLVDISIQSPEVLSSNGLKSIKESIPYASVDETKYSLCGLYFDKDRGQVAATDGHRILISQINLGWLEKSAIVPLEACKLLIKLVESYKITSVNFGLKDGYAVFDCHSFKIISRVIDSEYPDYMKVVPKVNYNDITVLNGSKQPLAELASKAAKFRTKKGGVNAPMVLSDGLVEFCDKSQNIELEASLHLPIKQGLKIGLNGYFLSEALKTCDRVAFIEGAFAPTYWTNDNGQVVILMPMRL